LNHLRVFVGPIVINDISQLDPKSVARKMMLYSVVTYLGGNAIAFKKIIV